MRMVSKKLNEVLCLLYSGLLFTSGVLLLFYDIALTFKLGYHFHYVPTESISPFVLVFLTSFTHISLPWLGIKGATKDHIFHILMFIAISILLLAAELAIGFWSLFIWEQVDVQSVELMKKSFQGLQRNYNKENWDKLQGKLHCCGINNASDYSLSIPKSCCDLENKSSACAIFEEGCKLPLVKYVKGLILELSLTQFSCVILQMMGICTFWYYYKAIKEKLAKESADRQSRRQALNLLRQNSLGRGVHQHTVPPTVPSNPSSPG